ncbi:MAG: AraC family transcriptional regulator [Bacteroidales bacterium]
MELSFILHTLFQTLDSIFLSLLSFALLFLLGVMHYNREFDPEHRAKLQITLYTLFSVVTVLIIKLAITSVEIWESETAEYVIRMGIIYQLLLPLILYLYQNYKSSQTIKRCSYLANFVLLSFNIAAILFAKSVPAPLLKGWLAAVVLLFSLAIIYLAPVLYRLQDDLLDRPISEYLTFIADIAMFTIVVAINLFMLCSLFMGRCLISSYSLKIILIGVNLLLILRHILAITVSRGEPSKKSDLFDKSKLRGIEPIESQFGDLKERLLKYFDEEKPFLESNINIKEVAAYLYTNKTYLSRLINDHFNSNFCQFVNYYRIEEAKRLFLENSSVTVQELCDLSGFGSIASFNISFRIFAGSTPAEWCREKRIESSTVNSTPIK